MYGCSVIFYIYIYILIFIDIICIQGQLQGQSSPRTKLGRSLVPMLGFKGLGFIRFGVQGFRV